MRCITLCCYTCVDVFVRFMNRLLLQFEPVTSKRAIDALVYALTIELYTQHRISSTMPAYNVIEFESERECSFAYLKLSGSSRYSIKTI